MAEQKARPATLEQIIGTLPEKHRTLALKLARWTRRSSVGGFDNWVENLGEYFPDERDEISREHGFTDYGHLLDVAEQFMAARNRLENQRRFGIDSTDAPLFVQQRMRQGK